MLLQGNQFKMLRKDQTTASISIMASTKKSTDHLFREMISEIIADILNGPIKDSLKLDI